MPQSPPPATGASVARRNPSAIWDSTESHSQISIAEPGRLAFCSGQVALPPDRGPVPRELGDQARLVAANLAANLDELSASPRDIVALRLYLVDATTARFLEAWAPIKETLGGDLPSLTGIGVAALWTPELQLEVEMVVRVP